MSDIRLLRERGRETPTIRTRVIGCVRLRGREPVGDFGINRVCVHPSNAAMTLKWNATVVGRGKISHVRDAPLDGHIVIPLGDHCVLARSFLKESDARDWAAERHEMPVPNGR